MNQKPIEIQISGLQHFCIKNKNPIIKLKEVYTEIEILESSIAEHIDLNYIYEAEDSFNFILITDINDWSYLIWKNWDFKTSLNFTKNLSRALNCKVNYYFIDSYTATSRWIFSDAGKITRAYYESHEEKLSDIGINNTENELRKEIDKTFVEDLFWELYEKTTQSLEKFNLEKRTSIKLYKGKLKTTANKV